MLGLFLTTKKSSLDYEKKTRLSYSGETAALKDNNLSIK
jgi:hypothetical protein